MMRTPLLASQRWSRISSGSETLGPGSRTSAGGLLAPGSTTSGDRGTNAPLKPDDVKRLNTIANELMTAL
jgi:hypothetical protein